MKSSGTQTYTAIILAAGKGTRMASPLPKVLHPVAGEPMIHRVLQACQNSGVAEMRVVVGHAGSLVTSVVEPLGAKCFTQIQQNGTADAVRSAQPENISGHVVVLNGDHPLLTAHDLQFFMSTFANEKWDVAVVSAELQRPKEFGRIVRHMGQVRAIVEAKDASSETLKIREVNTGIYVVKADVLSELLPMIKNNNLKKEYYLTDLISLALEQQMSVGVIKSTSRVAFGVNTQMELAQATRFVYQQKAKKLMSQGVLILDPDRTYIESSVEVAPGAVIHPNVHLKGKTSIGPFTSIEPNCIIIDCGVAESVQIKANSYLEKTKIKSNASIGPFARLRPETEIGESAQIGNFVELKKVKFGDRSKASHLSYLGDAEVGVDTNIGCGTITCNYAVDKKKYKTQIGDRVFVGSDSQFVAPVQVGDDSVIASGSTITENVPEKALALARSRQTNKLNYKKD